MKNFKKMMALALAMVMILSTMSISAFAAVPTEGSITINSPVVGAIYKLYKVFDMTTNDGTTAFSYSISEDDPFYTAVKNYAEAVDPEDQSETPAPINGLTLTKVGDTTTYNVSVDKDVFNAQKFGKAMQEALDGITEDAKATATVETSDQLKFEHLDLGYFLINPTYPATALGNVTMGEQTFTEEDLAKEEDELKDPLELTEDGQAKITAYVNATVTDEYVDQYLSDHEITVNKDGTPLSEEGKAEYKAELIETMTTDATAKVLAAFDEMVVVANESDINVKEPTLVFLDSSQPDAVINEKNELDKWDVPVNPEGEPNPGTPDHGEPSGGKNIVVQEDPAYYADWSEAEIGESVHYQLRVNAMNFIQDATSEGEVPQQVKEYFLADYQSGHMHFDESKGLHVSVWAGDDNNDSQASTKANVTKDANGNTPADGYLDYTSKAATFFKNTTKATPTTETAGSDAATKPEDIFGDGTGIMVPWVKVSEKNAELDPNYPIYTQTNVPKVENGQPVYKTEDFKIVDDARVPATTATGTVIPGQYVSVNGNIINGEGVLLDADNNPIQDYDTYYVYSLYNSDVTIVVDYWMILEDNAVVDEPGNKNYAQYGWSPVDNKDNQNKPKQPTPPSEEDKPSKKEEVDEATVYTFAIAWVKVDNKGNQLANAEFELPFYVKPVSGKDEDTYVYLVSKADIEAAEAAVEAAGEDATAKAAAQAELTRLNALKAQGTDKVTTTTESAVITIKGLEQGTYSITETKAPEGYNLLTAPFDVVAKKSGNGTTTKTKTTIYLDAQGNITDTETSTTVEYLTDEDSNVDNVPVYQFDPIKNMKGTELPSTGGIGTTIFYIIGAILVLGAGILLVTRRRMNAN